MSKYTSVMDGVNPYGYSLSPEQIESKAHRDLVGGLWEQMGELQFEFLKHEGLKPSDKLVDVGCGCLRGGVHFVRYLDSNHYYGLDINPSLLQAGMKELKHLGLDSKHVNLLPSNNFDLTQFQQNFDVAISISLFTHLTANFIVQCLVNVKKVLTENGVYYSSYFEAPSSAHVSSIKHTPGNIVTHYTEDPYHYSREEIQNMANWSGLKVDFIGDWNHPRNQKMVKFYK